jgi:isoleucyl-tRNA synthetase
VAWTPGWGQNRIEAAVKSRPDWCISRQRCWGVPIPAFYDAQGEPILDGRIVRAVADLVEKKGSNVWFEQTAQELWAQVRPPDWGGREPAAKSMDTLDVWIDSGSSSRSVLMATPELCHTPGANGSPAWQADLYLEGSDQHRGWFQSSLLLSLAGNGAAPYKSVLTHGFIVDADREKISKSKQGGYQKPQTSEAYVKKYGADVLRLWVSSQDCTNDIVVSDERVSKAGETYRGIRNALRYQLSNLFDFDPARDSVSEDRLSGLDRWVLEACARIEEQAAAAYEASQFHVVYQAVSQFVAVELSAVYHDVAKDRLYTDKADSARRRSTQTALYRLARSLCQMLSPILAFTADEAWRCLPGAVAGESVHATDWAPSPFTRPEAERAAWDKLFEIREKVLPALEKARQEKLIGKALEAQVDLGLPRQDHAAVSGNREALRELLNVSALALREAEELSVAISRAGGAKCERCWHWETTVGARHDHPTLCARCADAVQA